MQKVILSKLSFLLLATVILLGCQKGEQGDIGPQGPQGAKGVQGEKGEAGQANALGMVSTGWFTVKGSDWKTISTQNKHLYTHVLSGFSKEIVLGGEVYAYFKGASQEDIVYPLLFRNTAGWSVSYIPGYVGTNAVVQLYQSYTPPSSRFANVDYSFRVIGVPSSARGRLAHINWSNYEEVKEALELKD